MAREKHSTTLYLSEFKDYINQIGRDNIKTIRISKESPNSSKAKNDKSIIYPINSLKSEAMIYYKSGAICIYRPSFKILIVDDLKCSGEELFADCPNLTKISAFQHFDISQIKSFKRMFANDISLKDISPLQNWNISSEDDAFYGCTSLLEDVKNVTSPITVPEITELNENILSVIDDLEVSKVINGKSKYYQFRIKLIKGEKIKSTTGTSIKSEDDAKLSLKRNVLKNVSNGWSVLLSPQVKTTVRAKKDIIRNKKKIETLPSNAKELAIEHADEIYTLEQSIKIREEMLDNLKSRLTKEININLDLTEYIQLITKYILYYKETNKHALLFPEYSVRIYNTITKKCEVKYVTRNKKYFSYEYILKRFDIKLFDIVKEVDSE